MTVQVLTREQLVLSIQRRLAQVPEQFGFVMMPRDWMNQVVEILAAPRSCVHCLGETEPNGKCKNDSCIGAEYSFEDPHGWPK